jgi:hypothetical protein
MWCDTIEKAVKQPECSGFDEYLLTAMTLWESGGDASLISPSGARGIMQIMPRDVVIECPNGPCFADRPSAQELTDDQYLNIIEGCKDLQEKTNAWGSLRDGLRYTGQSGVGYTQADGELKLQAMMIKQVQIENEQ